MAAATRLCFSRNALLRLDKNLPISSKLKRKLWFFHILKPLKPPVIDRSTSTSTIPVRITRRCQRHPKPVPAPPFRFLSVFPRDNRHTQHYTSSMSCGMINVRSLHQKVDDVIDLQSSRHLDVLLITETWHDEDSVCIRRLRNLGFHVSEQARPRLRPDSISTNHGGVAIVSKPHVSQHPLSLNFSPSSFEVICSRLSTRASDVVIILIYRTGSVSSVFFDELSQILDDLALLSCPLLVTGDLNIHIERDGDPNARSLIDLLGAYGLSCLVDSSTPATSLDTSLGEPLTWFSLILTS